MLIESATNIVLTLLNALVSALPQLTEGALQLVLTLAQGILDNLPQIAEAAIQVIVTLAAGLGEALPELVPSIVEAIVLICSTLLDNMDQILAAAFSVIEGLAQGLLNALPRLVAALPQIITSITSFITNNLPKIVEIGIKLGTVNVATKRTWQCAEKNALSILRATQNIHGGDLIFDCPNRLVHLLTFGGRDTGALFAYKKNLKSIQRVVDTRNLVTRLYAYGKDGIASNHGDVMHWFPKHGKNMDTFRAAVRERLSGTSGGDGGGSASGILYRVRKAHRRPYREAPLQ